ncbi:MAG TPA: hypothetical protein PKE30_02060 [Niabella sp.]|nr:hypothetical protein [Niabella sp.]
MKNLSTNAPLRFALMVNLPLIKHYTTAGIARHLQSLSLTPTPQSNYYVVVL